MFRIATLLAWSQTVQAECITQNYFHHDNYVHIASLSNRTSAEYKALEPEMKGFNGNGVSNACMDTNVNGFRMPGDAPKNDYVSTFQNDETVSEFKLSMYDFGDYFPNSKWSTVKLHGYDVNGYLVSTAKVHGEGESKEGDACLGQGKMGNTVLALQHDNLKTIRLEFDTMTKDNERITTIGDAFTVWGNICYEKATVASMGTCIASDYLNSNNFVQIASASGGSVQEYTADGEFGFSANGVDNVCTGPTPDTGITTFRMPGDEPLNDLVFTFQDKMVTSFSMAMFDFGDYMHLADKTTLQLIALDAEGKQVDMDEVVADNVGTKGDACLANAGEAGNRVLQVKHMDPPIHTIKLQFISIKDGQTITTIGDPYTNWGNICYEEAVEAEAAAVTESNYGSKCTRRLRKRRA